MLYFAPARAPAGEAGAPGGVGAIADALDNAAPQAAQKRSPGANGCWQAGQRAISVVCQSPARLTLTFDRKSGYAHVGCQGERAWARRNPICCKGRWTC